MKAYIKRIREVNPIINAVIDQRFDAALKEAEMADDLCKSMSKEKLQSLYPLLGVPFTVKETCGVKGNITYLSKILQKKNTNFVFI